MDEPPERGEETDPDDRRIADAPESDVPEPDAPEAVDPEVRPWPLRMLSADDPDPPRLVEALGQVGIYLGVVAVGLAVVGLVAGTLELLSLARVAIFFAIVLASVGMGLGVVFQIFVLRG